MELEPTTFCMARQGRPRRPRLGRLPGQEQALRRHDHVAQPQGGLAAQPAQPLTTHHTTQRHTEARHPGAFARRHPTPLRRGQLARSAAGRLAAPAINRPGRRSSTYGHPYRGHRDREPAASGSLHRGPTGLRRANTGQPPGRSGPAARCCRHAERRTRRRRTQRRRRRLASPPACSGRCEPRGLPARRAPDAPTLGLGSARRSPGPFAADPATGRATRTSATLRARDCAADRLSAGASGPRRRSARSGRRATARSPGRGARRSRTRSRAGGQTRRRAWAVACAGPTD
jgi:hypothetical protein